ncbi:MAG: cyclic pyranopterin monophosphate synthase MoaC, partial [Balneolaceae bacterium]
MIDISHKRTSLRYARAVGTLHAIPETIERVRAGTVPKGDVASVARSAGILAAKRASEWLVFCHSMPVDWVEVRMELEGERIVFTAEVRSVWKTGMEMEAMTAVSAALLNAYDMLKPIQEDLWIGEIRLVEKLGGKSDMTDRFPEDLRAAIVIVSTEKKQGKRADRAGDAIRQFLSGQPVTVSEDVYV